MNTSLHRLREQRYFLLLCSLVGLMLLTPIAEITQIKRGPIELLWALVILSAVNAASKRRVHLRIAALLAVPAFLLNMGRSLADDPSLIAASDLFTIALLIFTVGTLLGPILRVRESDFDTICGAAAIYLMFALIWSVSYSLIETLAPGSFANMTANNGGARSEYLYFSLTTLTTLGYGEILPLSPAVRIWVTLEAVVGVLYVAILVAGLVSLYRR